MWSFDVSSGSRKNNQWDQISLRQKKLKNLLEAKAKDQRYLAVEIPKLSFNLGRCLLRTASVTHNDKEYAFEKRNEREVVRFEGAKFFPVAVSIDDAT